MPTEAILLRPAVRTAEQPARFAARPLSIPDVLLIAARRQHDRRGSFLETWRRSDFAHIGLPDFVQDNEVRSLRRGTLRGLHFQRPPHGQAKLVRALSGAIFDVAVDLRRGSPTFGSWVGATLAAEEATMLFVPRGFAHGYCTLADDTVVAYRCDAAYAPEYEGGLLFSDPLVGIEWPLPPEAMILSEKDRALPGLADLSSPFTNGERP